MRTKTPLLCAGLSLVALPATADQQCRTVEVRFAPQGLPRNGDREALSPQIAVWVEDKQGRFLADVFVTRLTGLLGLGNRPGQALLKSDFRWPYGRRPMALPIWAHGRGKSYGKVVMGGHCSKTYDPVHFKDGCPVDFTSDPSSDDNTVAYHGPVSSDEPFYCSPSGKVIRQENGVDVVSCASSFFGSKGWYATGQTSVYPPRADLQVKGSYDHPDVLRFAKDNDVAAISGATPPSGRVVDPPLRWLPPADVADDDYVMKVEVNIEGDFNPSFPAGFNVDEPHREWNHLGKQSIGQPSVLYAVPFRLDSSGRVATVSDYAGYGSRSGDSGQINPPDGKISAQNGSGADRLKVVSDDNGSWRVKVSVVPCEQGQCSSPSVPEALQVVQKSDRTLTLQLRVPQGEPIAQFQVKYQRDVPITAENFDRAMPVVSPNLGLPGQSVQTSVSGLQPQVKYFIAARTINRCGQASALVSAEVITEKAEFVTLSGCFIATAAYGSQMERHVATLRRFRDQQLLPSPLGKIAVASYYAVSPPLAAVISRSEGLRSLARGALAPIVRAVTE